MMLRFPCRATLGVVVLSAALFLSFGARAQSITLFSDFYATQYGVAVTSLTDGQIVNISEGGIWPTNGFNQTYTIDLTEYGQGNYTIILLDGGGDGGVSFEVNTTSLPFICGGNCVGELTAGPAAAFNFTLTELDGIPGCMDESACNYDSEAGFDDGSCCFDSCVTIRLYDAFSNGWVDGQGNIGSATVGNLSGLEYGSVEFTDGASVDLDVCLAEDCYVLQLEFDNLAVEASWEIIRNGQVILEGGPGIPGGIIEEFFFVGDPECLNTGCTTEGACNYDPTATQNNGACHFAEAIANDITVQLDASGTATIVPSDVDAGSGGGCALASSDVSPNIFNAFDIGTVPALLTVTDNQGNASSGAFNVTVQDLIPPVAGANDITLAMPNTDQEVILTALQVSTSTDNAGIQSLSLSKSSFFGCGDVTTHVVTLTVTDFAGNTDQVDFNVTITHPDVDNDGICDDQDNCTDITANNFDDPANGVCQPCGLAPVFLGFAGLTAASTLDAPDGSVVLNIPSGAPTSLELTGLNGALDLTVSIPNEIGTIPAGMYSARVRDDDGCLGVASAPGGTTFGEPAVSHTLIMPYTLCCSGCGDFDTDTDGICDGSDNCTDRTAPNFNDPANGPCE